MAAFTKLIVFFFFMLNHSHCPMEMRDQLWQSPLKPETGYFSAGSKSTFAKPRLPGTQLIYGNIFLNLSADCDALLFVGSSTSAYEKSVQI